MTLGKPRDPRKEELWRDTVTRLQASGLSIRAFCARHRLTESAFHAWRRTLAQRDRDNPSPPSPIVTFVPLQVHHDLPANRPHSNSSAATADVCAFRRNFPWPNSGPYSPCWRTPHAEPFPHPPHFSVSAGRRSAIELRRPGCPGPPGPAGRSLVRLLVRLPQSYCCEPIHSARSLTT